MRLTSVLAGLAFLGVAAGIVAFAMGAFRGGERVAPSRLREPEGAPAPARTATVVRGKVPVFEEAVGTVRSRTVVAVSSQVSARVLEVTRRSGAAVSPGDLLVRLDDREATSRVAQARQALAAAGMARRRAVESKAQGEARLLRATSQHERYQKMLAGQAIEAERAEAAETEWVQAKSAVAEAEAAIGAADAQIEQVKQVVAEAEIVLGYSRVASPIEGVVIERQVEPGDLAQPGRPLLVVLDPKALRLEAQVRESLISRIGKEQTLEVSVPAAGERADGTVAEIVPSADPLSRTFTVRVDLSPMKGVYAGMFGRLRIPLGTREAVRAPAAAVERVGQLETVLVRLGDRWQRRLVTTGSTDGEGLVEVLSGLEGGETVGVASEAR